MTHAFPEDELRPVSCTPLTHDRANPTHIEVNDVLGNYSLTLVDFGHSRIYTSLWSEEQTSVSISRWGEKTD